MNLSEPPKNNIKNLYEVISIITKIAKECDVPLNMIDGIFPYFNFSRK